MTIILRQTKGSALTHDELDGNFTDLVAQIGAVFDLPVGFGILTPDGVFHIYEASAGTVTALGGFDQLVVENSANTGISILTPDSGFGALIFGSPSNNAGAFVQWNYATLSLEIATSVAGSNLQFEINGVEAMRIDSSRNVGIGTFSPAADLEVARAGLATLRLSNTLVTILAGGELGAIDFYSGDLSGNGQNVVARVVGIQQLGTPVAGALGFYVGSFAGTEAMRINDIGNVGIGTITPDGQLHVHTASAGAVTASAAANDLVVEGSANTGISILALDVNTTRLVFGSVSDNIGAEITWNYNSGTMNLGSSVIGSEVTLRSGNNVEAIRIDSSQNVGIGTATPDGRLHVHNASAGTVTAHIDADELILENSANSGISILAPDAANSSIYFGSPTDNLGSILQWNYNGGLFSIGTSKAGAILNLLSGASTLALTIAANQGLFTTGATGSSQGSGTINAKALYDDGVQVKVPATVTGVVGSQIEYVDADSTEGTKLDLVAVGIGAAWESVGPTGSGATNIWTGLDNLPATTKWVRVRINTACTGSTITNVYSSQVYARVTGSASAANDVTLTNISTVTNQTGSTEAAQSVNEVTIPIDGSLRFDLYHFTTGTGTFGAFMYLVSFGE